MLTGPVDKAVATLERALHVAEASDDVPGIARALVCLGQAYLDRVDYASRRGVARARSGALRDLEQRIGEADAVRFLAMAYLGPYVTTAELTLTAAHGCCAKWAMRPASHGRSTISHG